MDNRAFTGIVAHEQSALDYRIENAKTIIPSLIIIGLTLTGFSIYILLTYLTVMPIVMTALFVFGIYLLLKVTPRKIREYRDDVAFLKLLKSESTD